VVALAIRHLPPRVADATNALAIRLAATGSTRAERARFAPAYGQTLTTARFRASNQTSFLWVGAFAGPRFMREVEMARLLGRFAGWALFGALMLAGCGATTSGGPAPSARATADGSERTDATFTFAMPRPSSGLADARRPQYVSAGTRSVQFVVDSVNGVAGTGPPADFEIGTNPLASGCVVDPANPADVLCTVSVPLPNGTLDVTIITYAGPNGTGNLISRAPSVVTVVPGAANGPPSTGYTVVLDAQPYHVAANVVNTDMNTTLVIPLAFTDGANHVIPPGAPGAPRAVLDTVPPPSAGNLVLSSDGQSVSFVPANSYTGSTSFTYHGVGAHPGDGITPTVPGTVTINVLQVN
jgi:hypothetical protein